MIMARELLKSQNKKLISKLLLYFSTYIPKKKSIIAYNKCFGLFKAQSLKHKVLNRPKTLSSYLYVDLL